jgi:hypothetical protein
MKRFEVAIEEPYKEHEKERRRSVEISAGFFDKLSTLSAASIAVSASIILAIAVKSDVHSGATQIVVRDLLTIAFLLWASLLLAIFHNFLGCKRPIQNLDQDGKERDIQRVLQATRYYAASHCAVVSDSMNSATFP